MAAEREAEFLCQTIFLEVAEKLRTERGSRFLAAALLRVCRVAAGDVLCLQSFGHGLYDLSFHEAPVCAAALKRLRAAAARGEEALRGIDFCMGSARSRLTLTVHVQDPFCPEEALQAFLQPYCERVGEGQKLCNSLGLWNGKRKFVVILKLRGGDGDGDSAAGPPGDILHPPAVFSIGASRGSLSYPGQPKYCGICSTSGHCKAECRKGICPHCGDRGHQPQDCQFRVQEEDAPWWEAEDMEDDRELPTWVDKSCGGRG